MLMDCVRLDVKLVIKYLFVKCVCYYFNFKFIIFKEIRCIVNKFINDICIIVGKYKNKVLVFFYWKEMDYFYIGILNLIKRMMCRIIRYL